MLIIFLVGGSFFKNELQTTAVLLKDECKLTIKKPFAQKKPN